MFGIVPKIQSMALSKVPANGVVYKWFASETGPFTGNQPNHFSTLIFSSIETLPNFKIVYFYCSSIKWFITLTNVGDIYTPVERVSSFQQTAMLASGFTWARYCTQIIPVNYGLMCANFAMGSIAMI
jgi:Mitochondrial pyruvate carriers